MKIMVVLGTRPEVIKLAPVIQSLKKYTEIVICSTGQHREMLNQALEIFKIKPDINLEVMSAGQTLNQISSKILFGMDAILREHQPEWVMVQGDTTSAFFAALAAFHLNIKIAHVEAGLRTCDLKNPFPEEGNRTMLARIADVHFAPTRSAKNALEKEGVKSSLIIVTGNTVVDSIRLTTANWISQKPKFLDESLKKIINQTPFIFVTCHRRESFGEVILGIAHMIKRLAMQYKEYAWVFPVHLNPKVREPIMEVLRNIPNIYLIDPVGYEASLFLISQSKFVLTDSGGIQEESPSFGVPVIVMRSLTERSEGVEAGFAKLAGQDPEFIATEVENFIKHPVELKHKNNPYGDGMASERILNYFLNKPFSEFNG